MSRAEAILFSFSGVAHFISGIAIKLSLSYVIIHYQLTNYQLICIHGTVF
jgi:hypothetical protein